jgi:pimeloyl-ACP methyl ester carboxylesterase
MLTTFAPTCEYVTSADGTRIYSEAVGDPTKPAIVFIHGFQLSSVAFDPIFDDPKWTDKLYLVRWLCLYHLHPPTTPGRSVTIHEGMEEVTSP